MEIWCILFGSNYHTNQKFGANGMVNRLEKVQHILHSHNDLLQIS